MDGVPNKSAHEVTGLSLGCCCESTESAQHRFELSLQDLVLSRGIECGMSFKPATQSSTRQKTDSASQGSPFLAGQWQPSQDTWNGVTLSVSCLAKLSVTP